MPFFPIIPNMKWFLLLTLFLSTSTYAAIDYEIPYPFFEQQQNEENFMMPLHHGEEAFQKRLDLIRSAEKSIDVEYYIYATDIIGKIFTRELVKAADRGVKVRILVDKLITELNSYYAKELAEHGIEVKYYNTSLLLKFSTVHYRNHRKLLIVDGKEAITGGRNMADEYFSLDDKYNFEDRDVLVKGPIVATIQDSFNAFYDHEISHTRKFPREPRVRGSGKDASHTRARLMAYKRATQKAKDFLKETDEEREAKAEIERLASLQLADKKFYQCPEVTFASDAPGANFEESMDEDYRNNFRYVRKAFLKKMLLVDKSVFISSPYFIANKRNASIYEALLDRHVDITLYTNSLRSTDAIFMSANLYLHLNGWLKKGMKMYLHDGHWNGNTRHVMEPSKSKRWGTHAKTHIYESTDGTEVMIGTYNIDNRSDYYNTELAVFCKGNDEFTQNVKEDMVKLAENGITIESAKEAYDRNGKKVSVTGADSIRELKMKLITFPSWLFDFLL